MSLAANPAITPASKLETISVVVIGRNEGDRLRRSLQSILAPHRLVIYVDSGSSDGSPQLALALGAEVIELDASQPFTAARGYNTGFDRALELNPDTEFVQFVDGDCELVAGWLDQARAAMVADAQVAVVCGRRREEFRNRNVFHRLIDMEWNTPIGELTECGAEGLMRVSFFRQVGGFDVTLIAGEEPELCLRLRRVGGKILRIDQDVSIHDVQMSRFQQWWRRTLRGGYAFAECSWRYGKDAEQFCVKQSTSILLWAGVLPLVALGLASWSGGLTVLGLVLLYIIQMARIARYSQVVKGETVGDAWLYGCFCILGKFAELQGQLEFWGLLLLRSRRRIVEYKSAPTPGTANPGTQ